MYGIDGRTPERYIRVTCVDVHHIAHTVRRLTIITLLRICQQFKFTGFSIVPIRCIIKLIHVIIISLSLLHIERRDGEKSLPNAMCIMYIYCIYSNLWYNVWVRESVIWPSQIFELPIRIYNNSIVSIPMILGIILIL